MNPKPEVGDKLFVTKISYPEKLISSTVTKVGYRFFSVRCENDMVDVQFRLDNWLQRTSFKPDFTISRTAP